MQEWINEMFIHLSKRFWFSSFIFVLILLAIVKILDKEAFKKRLQRVKYLRNKNNLIGFQLLASGLIMVLIGLIFNVSFIVPWNWFFVAFTPILGGLLALLPFSFIPRKYR